MLGETLYVPCSVLCREERLYSMLPGMSRLWMDGWPLILSGSRDGFIGHFFHWKQTDGMGMCYCVYIHGGGGKGGFVNGELD